MGTVDMELLSTLKGQLCVALGFTLFRSIFIEIARRRLQKWVNGASWWSRALPNQILVMRNFGYEEGSVSEDMALYGYVWVITMCITHVVSALLMLPVVVYGWSEAEETGRLCFFLGTLSEVGFDIYDFTKLVLLTFVPGPFPFLGPPSPCIKPFLLLGVFHHCTVLGMTIPMNLYYPSMAPYHRAAFALLFSAGVCYLTGQYKFTLDGKTSDGLQSIKRIVSIQFVMNWLARVIVWFPCVYDLLAAFHSAGDVGFFRGASLGSLGMSLYNVAVVMDATQAFVKWQRKSIPADSKK